MSPPHLSSRPGLHVPGSWLRKAPAGVLLSADEPAVAEALRGGPAFRFGVIADVQYADIENGSSWDGLSTRYYRGGLGALRTAVRAWSEVGGACRRQG